jgi:hypothetical protein
MLEVAIQQFAYNASNTTMLSALGAYLLRVDFLAQFSKKKESLVIGYMTIRQHIFREGALRDI